jgi:DNA-binding transcriptional MerR regulator
MAKTWNLEELAEESQRYLPDEEGDSKRIQWKPSGRLIRYYTTLGLLDRPHNGNGRAVWYGPRHLLQLLCIKKLQQEGLKLAAIQKFLVASTTEEMRRLVGLPESLLGDLENSIKNPPATRRKLAFWLAQPTVPQPTEARFEPFWRLELDSGLCIVLDEKQALGLTRPEREEITRVMSETWRKLQERKAKE